MLIDQSEARWGTILNQETFWLHPIILDKDKHSGLFRCCVSDEEKEVYKIATWFAPQFFMCHVNFFFVSKRLSHLSQAWVRLASWCTSWNAARRLINKAYLNRRQQHAKVTYPYGDRLHYLPWPPWATRHKIMVLIWVMSPKVPMQVGWDCDWWFLANVFAQKCCHCKYLLMQAWP